MSLTAEQLSVLKRPFARADHEFLRGYVYLTEDAVANRLEEVDPSWMFEIQRVERSGDQSIVFARLTVNGVSREGVGMQKVNEKAGEPEKGAATDALKRCARLFGVGRYLLDAPEESQFNPWLAGLQKATANVPKQPPAPQPRQAAPAPNAPASSSAPIEPISAPDAFDSIAETAPPNVYRVTQIKVVPQGNSHMYIMKAGNSNIPLFGGDMFRDIGLKPDFWKDNPGKWFNLKPELTVVADFEDDKWTVREIKEVS